jgi:hypothetical protein
MERGESKQVETGESKQVDTGESKQVETGESKQVETGESKQVETGESKQVETGDGRSGKARNKPVRFQKRLREADCILLLFRTVEYHKPYSGCNRKYQITFSSIHKISSSASSVHDTIGGTLQNHSFIDTWVNTHAVII